MVACPYQKEKTTHYPWRSQKNYLRPYVLNAVMVLDAMIPDWRDQIDWMVLDILNSERCIIAFLKKPRGQVWCEFMWDVDDACKVLDIPTDTVRPAFDLAYLLVRDGMPDMDVDGAWIALRDLWLEQKGVTR